MWRCTMVLRCDALRLNTKRAARDHARNGGDDDIGAKSDRIVQKGYYLRPVMLREY